tara:strand:+ start:853 stop:1416 length:564 start_codon:yes stop_codon:yes gene_type:complete
MDFHQSASERFAEQVFKYIVKEFDGKTINSDDCNLELMLQNLPQDFDDFDLEECLDNSPVTTVVEPDNDIVSVNDNNNNNNNNNNDELEPEIFQDNIDSSPKKVKKDKKNKKDKKKKSENNESNDTENKPKRKPNAFINFRTSSKNLDAIIKKSEEINEETGKKLGKVKAAGILWKNLSEEEQSKWK